MKKLVLFVAALVLAGAAIKSFDVTTTFARWFRSEPTSEDLVARARGAVKSLTVRIEGEDGRGGLRGKVRGLLIEEEFHRIRARKKRAQCDADDAHISEFVTVAKKAQRSRKATFYFKGRTYATTSARNQTQRWAAGLVRVSRSADNMKLRAEKYSSAATKLTTAIESLSTQRDHLANLLVEHEVDVGIAEIERDVTKLTADIESYDTGDHGKALSALEDQIVRLTAEINVDRSLTAKDDTVSLQTMRADSRVSTTAAETDALVSKYWGK